MLTTLPSAVLAAVGAAAARPQLHEGIGELIVDGAFFFGIVYVMTLALAWGTLRSVLGPTPKSGGFDRIEPTQLSRTVVFFFLVFLISGALLSTFVAPPAAAALAVITASLAAVWWRRRRGTMKRNMTDDGDDEEQPGADFYTPEVLARLPATHVRSTDAVRRMVEAAGFVDVAFIDLGPVDRAEGQLEETAGRYGLTARRGG